MKTFALTPLDAWFFRDGRPYVKEESNQADVTSTFPPPARTLSGALRAAVARANGWNGRGAWPADLNEKLGSGANDLGSLQFSGPFLIRGSEAFWPLPRHVLGRSTGSKAGQAWEPCAFLRPAEVPTHCDLGARRLPRVALVEKFPGLKTAESAWTTSTGLVAILAGKLPTTGGVVTDSALWSHEPRVGLHRDERTLVTGEGALYSPSYVRLRRGIALGIGLDGLPPDFSNPPGLFPLGGESRLARSEAWSGSLLPSRTPRETFRTDETGRVEFTIILLTPGRFPSGALDLPGVETVCACLGKAQFIGGWDSLARSPLPLEPFAPAGSVWFCSAPANVFEAVHARHGQWLGEYTAHGFGQIAIGVWPPS